MNAAVEFARSLPGVRYVHLCVSEQSGGAQALYERVGFRVWGTEPAAMVIDGGDVPEEHMVLTLPRPASGVRLPS